MKTNKVIYEGRGGYQSEIDLANKVFVKGQEYSVVKAVVYSSMTLYTIEGVEGTWNSVLFDKWVFESLPPDIVHLHYKL